MSFEYKINLRTLKVDRPLTNGPQCKLHDILFANGTVFIVLHIPGTEHWIGSGMRGYEPAALQVHKVQKKNLKRCENFITFRSSLSGCLRIVIRPRNEYKLMMIKRLCDYHLS